MRCIRIVAEGGSWVRSGKLHHYKHRPQKQDITSYLHHMQSTLRPTEFGPVLQKSKPKKYLKPTRKNKPMLCQIEMTMRRIKKRNNRGVIRKLKEAKKFQPSLGSYFSLFITCSVSHNSHHLPSLKRSKYCMRRSCVWEDDVETNQGQRVPCQ